MEFSDSEKSKKFNLFFEQKYVNNLNEFIDRKLIPCKIQQFAMIAICKIHRL